MQVVNGAMTVDAATGANVIVIANDDSSYVLQYNAGGQVASRRMKVNGTEMLEVSQYDTRGQLIYVFQPIAIGATPPSAGTPGALKEARYYDVLGRLVEQNTFYGAGETKNNIAIAGWRGNPPAFSGTQKWS